MKYRAYFLEFLTPVHFADNNFGGDLEKASFYCSADTYFSAICSEANLISKEILQSIIEKFEQRKLAISSLFPYYYSAPNDDLQLYLPKIYLSVDNLSKIDSYPEQKKYSRLWKQNDKENLKIDNINEYMRSLKHDANKKLATIYK
jgi:CRISPR-associated protein Csm4